MPTASLEPPTDKILADALRQSEDRYRFLTETIPVQVWTATPDGSLDYVSEQTARHLGTTPAKLLAEGWQNVLHPDDLPRAIERWTHALRTGETYEVEFRLKVGPDEYAWHLARAVPQRGPQGTILQWIGTNTNIEARRREQAERTRLLEESQRAHLVAQAARDHLTSLFMQAPAPICILRGPEHTFELANPMYRQLVGNRALEGLPVREALPELAGQGFFELLDRVYATGERFIGRELPLKLAREGAETLDDAIVTFVYDPFREVDGNVVGILVLATDVTETVRARRELERTLADVARRNDELSQADTVLRTIVNNLPELAWSTRADGFIDFYNQRWFDYTGTTLEEMEGWGWQRVHDPVILPRVLEMWAHSIESGEAFEMEFPIRAADGSFRWFLTRVTPLRDAGGRVVRWFGMNTDIHAQREAARKAHEANTAKDEFLATASHELRNPLNAILGWARLLRSGQLDASAYLRGVETIERNAKAQVHLIEDILDGSRIITGKLHLETRPLDMTAVVQAALDAVRPAAAAKGIELLVHLDPDAAGVSGDPERLQQVVWNLANNAVKFTPKGGKVEVRLERSGTHIQLAVADSGQGISKDFLPHVFERFLQAEGTTTRRHGGLGLGLALVRHLVEAHGGSVRAESEGEGRGARFVVLLPVEAVRQDPVDVDRPPRVQPAEDSAPIVQESLSGVTVLVVDDQPDARDLVATVLQANGAEVTTASSAEKALDLLSKFTPMVLISDVGMPDVDGYELMRRARRLAGTASSEIPAIALTAYSREQDRRLALEAGFQTHVAKPVEPAELVRVVAGLVGFVGRQSSPGERKDALAKADVFLKFEKILATQGLHEAVRFLNSRTSHRFSAMYRFDPPTLRNILLVDSYSADVTKGDDAPMAETYCSIVGETERSFTTEDTTKDDRLRTHPARENIVSYCGVLLRDIEGKPFGALCHFDKVPCDVPISEMPLMEAAAPLLMKALRATR
jgi:PAS domain S-box-containing protein